MLKKILLWVAVIGMSIIIFCFSAKPSQESAEMSKKIAGKAANIVENKITLKENKRIDFFENIHYFVRKSAHFLEFAILSVLTFYLAKGYRLSLKICIIVALSYCIVFAIGDEIHQLFVEGREGRVTDVLIDFFGSSVGVGVCCLFIKLKKSAKQKHS